MAEIARPNRKFERAVEIAGKFAAINIMAIGCLVLHICQHYPDCDGDTIIEAGDVICKKCGKIQECGDVVIKRTCRAF